MKKYLLIVFALLLIINTASCNRKLGNEITESGFDSSELTPNDSGDSSSGYDNSNVETDRSDMIDSGDRGSSENQSSSSNSSIKESSSDSSQSVSGGSSVPEITRKPKPTGSGEIKMNYDYIITVVKGSERPVISKNHPGSADNEKGYENGHVIKTADGKYHMLITEMFTDGQVANQGHWSPARIGHWISDDGSNWERFQTIVQGNAIYRDPKENTWSPSWYWNKEENKWNIIWRGSNAVFRYSSNITGINGIKGKYSDSARIIPFMRGKIQSWDYDYIHSFGNVYKAADGKYYSFYGLINSVLGHYNWYNALAYADNVDGPWTRVASEYPEFIYSENPYVYQYDDMYFAVYDDLSFHHSIGFAYSEDGINWTRKTLDLSGYTPWVMDHSLVWTVRTPFSLIREKDGTYTVFFTGYNQASDYFEIGKISVKIEKVERESESGFYFPGDMNLWKSNVGTWLERYGEYLQINEIRENSNSVIRNKIWNDFSAEIEFKIVEKSYEKTIGKDGWAGIHVRKTKQDDGPFDSGYLVSVSPAGEINLYRKAEKLASARTRISPYIYRKLTVEIKGNRIKVFYAGEKSPVIDVVDNTYKQGYISINTSRTICHFKSVKVNQK